MKQQQAFRLLKDIIEGIKSGELLHNQLNYHTRTDCGTAHCIAGWLIDRTIPNMSYTPAYGNILTIEEELCSRLTFADREWDYSRNLLHISDSESFLLFEPTLDIETIERNFYILVEKYSIDLG